MTPVLSIITAVSRPWNLGEISRSLESLHGIIPWCWVCVADGTRVESKPPNLNCHIWDSVPIRDRAGGLQKNRGLEHVSSGWVYFLDDDNLLHPGLVPEFLKLLKKHPNATGFVFGCGNPTGTSLQVFPSKNSIGLGRLDLSQFLLLRESLQGVEFPADKYSSDWELFSGYWKRFSETTVFGPPVTWYNALRRSTASRGDTYRTSAM